MIATATLPETGLSQLQSRFLSILPRIRTHARIYFRNVKCPDKKADRVAEAVGLAWKWFVRLAEQGKDATQFPSVLASYAARAVKSGRRVCGQLKAKDVMNEQTQQRQRFVVSTIPNYSTLSENPLAEALIDNTRSPVPDQVCFRQDFPAWRRTRTQRDRRLITEMARGERTLDLSKRFGISQARVSQLRREFQEDWERFCAVPDDSGEIS